MYALCNINRTQRPMREMHVSHMSLWYRNGIEQDHIKLLSSQHCRQQKVFFTYWPKTTSPLATN